MGSSAHPAPRPTRTSAAACPRGARRAPPPARPRAWSPPRSLLPFYRAPHGRPLLGRRPPAAQQRVQRGGQLAPRDLRLVLPRVVDAAAVGQRARPIVDED